MSEALNSAGGAGSTREAALLLAKSGIPIFPCKTNKKPFTNHGFKDASTDTATIEGWWKKWPDAWIGLRTGKPAGLVVVDVDCKSGKKGHDNLIAKHGVPPATFATSTPSGGYHLFYKWPGGKVTSNASKIADGVDVRGDGGYVIFPPSGNYRIRQVNEIAPLPAWASVTEYQSNRVTEQQSNGVSENQKPLLGGGGGAAAPVMTEAEAIGATLPSKEGVRNAAVFNFARAMKFECGYASKPFPLHLPHVQEWHRRALPFIKTKEFEDTLADYLHGLKTATTPFKANPLADAWEKAKTSPPPIPDFGFPICEQTKDLYCFMYWLGQLSCGNPFWASVRDIGKRTGGNPQTIWRRLSLFENMGVLRVVEKGTQGAKGKATRYLWAEDGEKLECVMHRTIAIKGAFKVTSSQTLQSKLQKPLRAVKGSGHIKVTPHPRSRRAGHSKGRKLARTS